MKKRWIYIAFRFGQMLIILLIITTMLFLIFRLMPGNPVAAFISPTFTAEQQEIIMHQFGLDKTLWQQYLLYMSNLLKGQLGETFFFIGQSVSDVIFKVLPNTLYLTLGSFIIVYSIGIFGGIFLASKRDTIFDNTGIILTLLSRSAPQFWVGLVFLAIFSFELNWFPSAGVSSAGIVYASEFDKLTSLQFWHHLFLPMLTQVTYLFGLPLLLQRSSMLDIIGEAYVDMARMRGLSERRVLFKYIARNALLPVVTTMALSIGYAMGGTVLIETVFSWPGIGRILVKAVTSGDYPLAQGAFTLIAVIMVGMNFIADILYSFLDPRIEIGGE